MTTFRAHFAFRVDYVNGLQENLKGQEAASEEVRAEFNAYSSINDDRLTMMGNRSRQTRGRMVTRH
jgi:hypothetical protein